MELTKLKAVPALFCIAAMVSCKTESEVVQPIAQNFGTEAENMWTAENRGFAKVFEFVRNNNLSEMEPGTYPVDGEQVYLIIMDSDLKLPHEARLEVHDKYYDLQVPISGPEGFGYLPRPACKLPDAPMNAQNDIQFFDDKIENVIYLQPMQFIVFAPSHAHAPTIGEGTVRKAVFKIQL